MTDDVMLAMATALATQTATMAAAGGKAAVAKLAGLVRRRFAREPEALAALEAAEAAPADAPAVDRLRGELARACEADPGFARELRELWDGAGSRQTASGDGTIVNFSGRAENAYIARDMTINNRGD